jgi:hypothetical protein
VSGVLGAATAAGYGHILHALQSFWDFGQSTIREFGVRSVSSAPDAVGAPVLRIPLNGLTVSVYKVALNLPGAVVITIVFCHGFMPFISRFFFHLVFIA